MLLLAKRNARRQSQRDADIRLLAETISLGFMYQLLGYSAVRFAGVLTRTVESVDMLTNELLWDELDEKTKQETEEYVRRLDSTRYLQKGTIILSSCVVDSTPCLSNHEYNLLAKHVQERLQEVAVQSVIVEYRIDGTVWLIGRFSF